MADPNLLRVIARAHGIQGRLSQNTDLTVHDIACEERVTADYNQTRPHSRLGWMSPAIYAAARRSAALRSIDGSAQRTAAIIARPGISDGQTPIAAG